MNQRQQQQDARTVHLPPPQHAAPVRVPALDRAAIAAAAALVACVALWQAPSIVLALPKATPMAGVLDCLAARPEASPVACGCAAWTADPDGVWQDERGAYCVGEQVK